jgi:hypothetical protein
MKRSEKRQLPIGTRVRVRRDSSDPDSPPAEGPATIIEWPTATGPLYGIANHRIGRSHPEPAYYVRFDESAWPEGRYRTALVLAKYVEAIGGISESSD